MIRITYRNADSTTTGDDDNYGNSPTATMYRTGSSGPSISSGKKKESPKPSESSNSMLGLGVKKCRKEQRFINELKAKRLQGSQRVMRLPIVSLSISNRIKLGRRSKWFQGKVKRKLGENNA